MEVEFDDKITSEIKAEFEGYAVEQIDDMIEMTERIHPKLEPWIRVKKTPFGIGEMIDGIVINVVVGIIIKVLNKLKEMLSTDSQATPT